MSKVEQGEPRCTCERPSRNVLGRCINCCLLAAASLPESQPVYPYQSPAHDDLVKANFIHTPKPVSQPAPEMDYQQEALSLQDAIDNIVPCTEHEVAVIAEWLRAHDARVQPDVSVLMDALKSISDPPKDACGCEDHECAECCVNADYHCPECIAGHAIANLNKSDARVQPSRVAGTERLREALKQIAETAYDVLPENLGTAMDKITELAESALKESSHDK